MTEPTDDNQADFFALWDAYEARQLQPNSTPPAPNSNGDSYTAYVAAVCRNIATTPQGQRNDTLNRGAYRLGGMIAAGQIPHQPTAQQLTAAGLAAGLEPAETTASIRSGLGAGMRNPRPLQPRETTTDLNWLRTTTLDPQLADTFWPRREALQHLHDFARARMCSPWAVLAAALVRVTTLLPPYVVLPAIIGSETSLNLYAALVGPSGAGKGAADAAAADALHHPHLDIAHIGSGEGIAHLFARRVKGEVERTRDAVLFIIPEIDNMTALGQRQGATLLPQLRMAWTGERLGFAYVDPAKNLPIDRHTYRLGLLLGVQPGRAAPLLDDADGGTPQRFLWLPTTDPDIPDTAPPEPQPWTWKPPLDQPWISNIRGVAALPIPTQAAETIRSARRDRMRGEADALDGHALLTRLKVAAALALLDQRRAVNDQDWDLAGTIMQVSDHTRAEVQRHLLDTQRARNEARGEAEADRAIVISDKLTASQIKRVCNVILRAMRRTPEDWVNRRIMMQAIAGRDRPVIDEAVGALLDAGQIELLNEDGKVTYRLTERDS